MYNLKQINVDMIWYDPSSDFSQLDLPAPYLRLISLLPNQFIGV